ncbi:MAG: M48 family metallopeptidase [bacterium]|nr:M48 family metallopeptidase [bacterium]
MNLWTQADANKRRSVFLILGFVVFVVAVGWLISYYYSSPVILFVAIIVAVVQSLVSYFSGDKIVLAASGAREIAKKDNPLLWNVVENLAITAGLPQPKVYIIPDEAPNAFATGRDPEHASVAVTSGLLGRLEKKELEGVIAHEMSHVGNFDIRLMTIVAILVSVVALVSQIFVRAQWFGFGGRNRSENEGGGSGVMAILGIVAIILAPIVAMIVQLAISRKREFLADADGALLTRYPDGLADALTKISRYSEPVRRVSSATAHLYISNPLGGGEDPTSPEGLRGARKQSTLSKLFSTHPPIAERIKILRGMDV